MAVARIREFLLSIQAAKLSRGSLNNYKAATMHLYDMNDISLNWKKIKRFACMEYANTGIKEKDRAYTHKEIQSMLQHSNTKVRAIILLLASLGIRVGAVQSICLKHLLKIRIDKNGISLYQLTIYPGHKDQHITFCTPEATEAIDSYLSYRIRAGEQLNDQSPLFRRDFRADDLFKVRNNIKPIETDAVSKKIQTILRESGLLSKYQTITESQVLTRHEVQRNHQHSNDFG